MYFLASIPLYSSLSYHDLGTYFDLLPSLLINGSALLGQYLGIKIRNKITNAIFRKTILIIFNYYWFFIAD